MPNPKVNFTLNEINLLCFESGYTQKINYKFGEILLVKLGKKLVK